MEIPRWTLKHFNKIRFGLYSPLGVIWTQIYSTAFFKHAHNKRFFYKNREQTNPNKKNWSNIQRNKKDTARTLYTVGTASQQYNKLYQRLTWCLDCDKNFRGGKVKITFFSNCKYPSRVKIWRSKNVSAHASIGFPRLQVQNADH